LLTTFAGAGGAASFAAGPAISAAAQAQNA
jgi:hypothetical protein